MWEAAGPGRAGCSEASWPGGGAPAAVCTARLVNGEEFFGVGLMVRDSLVCFQQKDRKSKKSTWKFCLDLTHPVEDGIFDSGNFVSRGFAHTCDA